MKAVSSWSLHRTLGSYVSGDGPGGSVDGPTPADGLDLLDLPAELARRGFDTVQLCHFHLPRRDEGYLAELRSALDAADIGLDALLVDDGDLTDPDDADRDQRWIDGWLDVASALGARRARVVAGKLPPTTERLADSGRRLGTLADAHPDLRVVTENWFDLTPGPTEVSAILDAAGGRVGLLLDLGNWTGPTKYDDLAAVAPSAETCHAKCHFSAAGPDRDDYARSLQVLHSAGYTGPLALVYDGPDGDEWAGLAAEHAIAGEVFG